MRMTVAPTAPSVVDLEAILRDVWSALMLDAPAPADPGHPSEGTVDVVTATVSVTGEWNGHISVQTGYPTAAALGGAMLGIEPADVERGDLIDAMGELVNIVGGNIKAMLEPPNQLSLPHVVVGASDSYHWPGAVEMCHVDAFAAGGTVSVSIWSSSGEGAPR
jgi:chemotaxis protein CheX